MDRRAVLWYFLDMIEGSFSHLPGIEAGATGRVSIVGTIRKKTALTTRTTSSYDSYALVMLHAGRGTLASGTHPPAEVTEGDLMLLFPGVPHEYGPDAGKTWDESYIVFSGELFDALLSGHVITPERPILHNLSGHWQDRFLGLIRLASKPEDGVLVRTPAPVYLALLASFICEAVSAYPVHHVNPSDDRWLEEACAALDIPQPMSQSLSEVARRLGTSYGSFVKRFTRLSGSAPGQTRTRIAMQHACRLLREGELTVSQISSELGVEILNPVQPESMDFESIHACYGDRLSFWGTIGTQRTMPFGSVEDVKNEVRRNVAICGEAGGIVIGPTHVVEPEVPWENIVALREACDELSSTLVTTTHRHR